MYLSVIIATYNRGEYLVDTIEQLFQDSYPHFELIVVDQTLKYTQEIQEKLMSLHNTYQFKIIKLPYPSLTVARNVGLLESIGEVVIFCDDDVILSPGYMESHASCYSDPDVGGVAGRVGKITGGKTPNRNQIVGKLMPDGNFVANFDSDIPKCEVDFGIGCNMSFRRQAILSAGGFDERYKGNFYREESDAFAKVKALGWKIVFEPKAFLEHLVTPDGGCRKDVFVPRMYSMFRNETLFFFNTSHKKYLFLFLKRVIIWIYATVKVENLGFKNFLYFIISLFDGILCHYFKNRHNFNNGKFDIEIK